MAEIGIPEEGFAGIRELLGLGIDGLRQAIDATGPCLVSPRERAVLVDEAMGGNGDVDSIERILAYFVQPLHTLRQQFETTAAGIYSITSQALKTSDRTSSQLWTDADNDRWSELKPQLVSLLGSETASIEAKANALLRARPNKVQSLRVYSDIRPVFDESREVVDGNLVTNTLRVRYFDGSTSQTVHLSMEPSDLDKLDEQIQRARQKNDQLRAQNEQLGVRFLLRNTSAPCARLVGLRIVTSDVLFGCGYAALGHLNTYTQMTAICLKKGISNACGSSWDSRPSSTNRRLVDRHRPTSVYVCDLQGPVG